MTPETIYQVVAVSGFCFFSYLINPALCLIPAFMAIIFPAAPVAAAFVAFVTVLFIGSLVTMIKHAL